MEIFSCIEGFGFGWLVDVATHYTQERTAYTTLNSNLSKEQIEGLQFTLTLHYTPPQLTRAKEKAYYTNTLHGTLYDTLYALQLHMFEKVERGWHVPLQNHTFDACD